jgi:hypothetical protein
MAAAQAPRERSSTVTASPTRFSQALWGLVPKLSSYPPATKATIAKNFGARVPPAAAHLGWTLLGHF